MNPAVDRIRGLVPLSFRRWRHQRREASRHRGGNLYCPVCRHPVHEFLPHGIPARNAIKCPICDSKACHRLAWAWFQQDETWLVPSGRFVHIAPEFELGRWLAGRCKSSRMNYIAGDIRDPRNRLDIAELPFDDGSIDVLFACHVLNMLPDDGAAFDEIARTLRPGGLAILPVPIYTNADPMLELGATATINERKLAFGDPMMYRKYSDVEYRRRLENSGFRVTVVRPSTIDHPERSRWELCDEYVHVVRPGATT